jgi:hypothetical protein
MISSENPKPHTRKARREIQQITGQFPPGSLVMIEWVGEAPYNSDENGYELEAPEPAVVVRMLPELAERSTTSITSSGPWVVPFECLHGGALRVSTTFATRLAEEQNTEVLDEAD